MPGNIPPDFDPAVPSIARIWDYWLGGSDYFPADVEAAEYIKRINPHAGEVAKQERLFLGRAVTYAASQGIAQFLDLGSGLPSQGNVHEVAHDVNPAARVAYVDNDPYVTSHADATVACDGVVAVQADLADADGVLASPGVLSVIRLGEPVCVIFGSVLHFLPADLARDLVARYAARTVRDSITVISVARTGDQAMFEKIRTVAARAGQAMYNHSEGEAKALFGGLDLVPPGVVPVRAWRGGMPDPGLPPLGPAYALAGVARKPLSTGDRYQPGSPVRAWLDAEDRGGPGDRDHHRPRLPRYHRPRVGGQQYPGRCRGSPPCRAAGGGQGHLDGGSCRDDRRGHGQAPGRGRSRTGR